jgi:hypothetical protein
MSIDRRTYPVGAGGLQSLALVTRLTDYCSQTKAPQAEAFRLPKDLDIEISASSSASLRSSRFPNV